MNNYITAQTVKRLREKKGLTQSLLAEKILVSDKTISKWETAKGLPDISLIEPLAEALGVSVMELMSGENIENKNVSGNIKHSKFYICPVCGNVICTVGEALVSCCGITLPVSQSEEADEEHFINVETVENEYFVSMAHDMEKTHYISFFALVTSDRIEIVKLYHEGNAEARFDKRGSGVIYAYCNKHGLMSRKISKK